VTGPGAFTYAKCYRGNYEVSDDDRMTIDERRKYLRRVKKRRRAISPSCNASDQ